MATVQRKTLTLARLRWLCDLHGISQRALSRASGIHQPNISLIFTDQRTPTSATMTALTNGYYTLRAEAKNR